VARSAGPSAGRVHAGRVGGRASANRRCAARCSARPPTRATPSRGAHRGTRRRRVAAGIGRREPGRRCRALRARRGWPPGRDGARWPSASLPSSPGPTVVWHWVLGGWRGRAQAVTTTAAGRWRRGRRRGTQVRRRAGARSTGWHQAVTAVGASGTGSAAGTVRGPMGRASSAGSSLSRVARQYFGASSSTRLRGHDGRTRKRSQR